MNKEGLFVEYKREYAESFKHSVVAFANGDGGEIFFGLEDDGSVLGIENPDSVMLQITNAIRDCIRPDVTLFTKCETVIIEEKNIIHLTVNRGTARPYYIAGKGIRPEGVFVRQGASSVPASETAILQMIKESSNYVYESERSLEQNLTFTEAQARFDSRKVEFGDIQKKTLGLVGTDEMYSNLALLLSDQCPHIIKIAVFQGSNKTLFKDRREFSGSVLKQLDDAYAFLDLFNRTRAEIVGLERIDSRDYPGEALRETLLNTIVHRDYGVLSPALISIFDDRIEFVSVGGLVPGISYDDIMLGVSVARNPKLAEVFYRLHLIEAYGTGILKINESYNDSDLKAKIEVSSHAFKVTLPNVNFPKEQAVYKASHTQEHFSGETVPCYGKNASFDNSYSIRNASVEYQFHSQPREEIIEALFKRKQFVSRKDIEEATNTSQPNAVLILKKLLQEGKIRKVGEGKNTRYMLNQ